MWEFVNQVVGRSTLGPGANALNTSSSYVVGQSGRQVNTSTSTVVTETNRFGDKLNNCLLNFVLVIGERDNITGKEFLGRVTRQVTTSQNVVASTTTETSAISEVKDVRVSGTTNRDVSREVVGVSKSGVERLGQTQRVTDDGR